MAEGRQFFQAVSDKNMKVMNILLQKKPIPSDIFLYINNSQQNALMTAVQLSPEQDAVTFTAVVLSIKSPACPLDAVNKFGQTALMLVAKKGKLNCTTRTEIKIPKTPAYMNVVIINLPLY